MFRDAGPPHFLAQFCPGYVFASAVWHCVDLLERARYYVEAVGLLRQLLASPHTPHRRGRWWNRLSLDLTHLGQRVPACVACLDALDDPAVPPGDRITLQRRLQRLQRHVGAAANAMRSRRNGECGGGGGGGGGGGLSGGSGTPVSRDGQDRRSGEAAGG